MRIDITYDSCWQNSFLTGDDDKPVSKNNERKFKATSKSKIVDMREVSNNTIMGVLCRLIGDQRKLYQSKQDENYYFQGIESSLSFTHRKRVEYQETAFIINKSDGRPPQGSFLGVLPNDLPLFFSAYAQNIWRVLDMSHYELLDFILNGDEIVEALGEAVPRQILSKLDSIQSCEPYQLLASKKEQLLKLVEKEKEKIAHGELNGKNTAKEHAKLERLNSDLIALENPSEEHCKFDQLFLDCADHLRIRYPEKPYIEQGKAYLMKFYAAGLYVALERLKDIGVDVSVFLNKNNNIQGFNPCGFNGIRDFLNPLTGGGKRCGGTPTQLTKASGILEINLDIPKEKAEELKEMIENAGVSSFYLGKKGLAYVSDIRT
jgi:hypothetical protein